MADSTDTVPLSEHVSFRRHDGVAVVTLADPRSRNALNDEDMAAITSAAAMAAEDRAVRALLLIGAGATFCSGAHMSKMDELLGAEPSAAVAALTAWQAPLLALERLEMPVVAAIDGLCLAAGAALILAADVRIASEKARIAFPSVNVGLVTDLGCSWRLPRIVGAGWAAHWLLTGDWIDAPSALRAGLVTLVLPGEGFDAAALAFVVDNLLPKSSIAQAAMKRLLTADFDGLPAALEREAVTQAALYREPDAREGRQAISERRAARFGSPAE